MTQSTELTSAGDDEQIRLEPDQHEMAAPARKCIERAFVDSLAQFDELYRQLARYSFTVEWCRPSRWAISLPLPTTPSSSNCCQ